MIMGATNSKSSLERRNTVLRRSQRKSVYGIKGKIEVLQKDIKKFKGVEEDEKFEKLEERLEALKKEHRRQGKGLQKEIKQSYDTVGGLLSATEKLLSGKIKDNLEKQTIKEKKKLKKKNEEVTSNTDENDNNEIEDEEDLSSQVTKVVENHTEDSPRKVVELHSVRVDVINSDASQASGSVICSPVENKRKSILKMGVPVMPNAMLDEITQRQTKTSLCFNDELQSNKEINQDEQLENIIEKLRRIEFSINTFNGIEGSEGFNKIFEELSICKSDLNQIEVSKEIYSKWDDTSKYCLTCENFLEEKVKENAQPKLPKNNSLKQYRSNEELNEAYSKLSKSTNV